MITTKGPGIWSGDTSGFSFYGSRAYSPFFIPMRILVGSAGALVVLLTTCGCNSSGSYSGKVERLGPGAHSVTVDVWLKPDSPLESERLKTDLQTEIMKQFLVHGLQADICQFNGYTPFEGNLLYASYTVGDSESVNLWTGIEGASRYREAYPSGGAKPPLLMFRFKGKLTWKSRWFPGAAGDIRRIEPGVYVVLVPTGANDPSHTGWKARERQMFDYMRSCGFQNLKELKYVGITKADQNQEKHTFIAGEAEPVLQWASLTSEEATRLLAQIPKIENYGFFDAEFADETPPR